MNFSLNPLFWVRGEVVGRDKIGAYTVDTCDTMDCGYETGIMKDGGEWIIVEYYKNSEQAKIGHQKWCKFCESNPSEVYSVQMEEIEKF